MKKTIRIIAEIIAFILALTTVLGVTSYLGYRYMPDRRDYGATWNMYLKEQEDSIDLMFVGSSMAYCDIIPARIYQNTGHTTYVVSAPYMMPDTAYYYLKEALKTQSPEVVMVEATSFFFSINEADYYKVNIGYMPYSLNRLEATLFAAPNKEKLGLLFPLFNYHERWEQYSLREHISPRPDAVSDIMAGYTYLGTAQPQNKRYHRSFLYTEEEYERGIKYMNKIIDLCKDNDIELEFFIVPACEYVSPELTDKLREEAGEIKVTNFNDSFGELGLDFKTDFYDKRHVNFKGAVKFTDYLSEYITKNYELPSNSHDQELWKERVKHINEKLS
ncbi:MAG: hypothetical protein IKT46_09100 [Clostridia bacterium]|nr:hypothetical protein [Clostridia bacterium]